MVNVDGILVVDCFIEGEGGFVNFNFDGKDISVFFGDFVFCVFDIDICFLGVYEDSFFVFGINFFRVVYVVFD